MPGDTLRLQAMNLKNAWFNRVKHKKKKGRVCHCRLVNVQSLRPRVAQSSESCIPNGGSCGRQALRGPDPREWER